MHITLQSVEGDKNFVGTNERGQTIEFSGSKAAVGPMESVLMAAAACSSIDVDMILRKMRQDFSSIKVEANAQRAEDKVPAVFTHINLHYIILGKGLKSEKVADAVEKSVEKYCSVITMLEKTAKISHSYEIINE
jgi:putative redox protein